MLPDGTPKRRSWRGFDLLAPHYRWMERLLAGSKLQACRTKYLPAVAGAKKILLLGEGHGRFLCEVVRSCPDAEITCLDRSRKMLVEARKAVRRARLDGARVNFIEADVLDYEFPFRTHDAVATHFFLDCFAPEQLEKVVTRIAATLAPGGAWLLADFHLPPQGVQRWRVAIILKIMYVFFRAATGLPARTLANPDSFLERNGLVLIERHLLDWGLLHSDLWRKPQPSSSQQLKTLLPKLNLIR